MMIAEREQVEVDVVRAGVTDEELARIVALAGFAPADREGSTLAADDHPVVVAAQVASAAVTLRVIAVLVAMIVVGGVAAVLV